MSNFIKRKFRQRAQTLMELVVGIGLVTIVAGAIAIVTVNSLRNAQYAKNQVIATKKAQENIEKVRVIKNNNYGVCTQSNVLAGSSCSRWEEVWGNQFGKLSTTCLGCTFKITGPCGTSGGSPPAFCLTYIAQDQRDDYGNGFTGVVIIEDEGPSQKRVTSRVFWSDASGEHSSDLSTIFSRI